MHIPIHQQHCHSDEEDASVSSTIAVVGFEPIKVLQPSQPPQASLTSLHKKKSVRFNENDNQSYEKTQICMEDCQQLCWYNANDYAHFKATTIYMASEIARFEKARKSSPFSYHRVLKRTYAACCQFPSEEEEESSGGACLENDSAKNGNNSSSVLTLEQQQHLQQWLSVSTSRLGLERIAIRAIAVDKSQRKRELVEIILELQQMYSSQNNNNSTRVAELLCTASQELSRPSRLFARQMAAAQAPSV